MEYQRYLNDFGNNLTPNPIRETYSVLRNAGPDTIYIGGGTPEPQSYPIEKISLTLKDGTVLDITNPEAEEAQKYSATQGSEKYQSFLREFVKRVHDPPCWDKSPAEGRTVVVPTAGATDGVNLCFRALTSPGDNILVENVTYAGASAQVKSMQLNPIPLEIDGDGIVPDSMRSVLSRWDPEAEPGTTDKPKLLYTIPTGQNPAGAMITLDRKREIYKLAQEYKILIWEDDPYHHMSFTGRVPSFLSLDTDGRVIRVDSFSKVISPGFRAGIMVGPEPLLSKLTLLVGLSTQGTSAMSQAIILRLLDHWGLEGFLKHTERSAEMYKARRDFQVGLVRKHLGDLVEFDVPQSGMFIWLKIKNCDDTKDLIFNKALQEKVFAVPGIFFQMDKAQKSSYLRIGYSNLTDEKMEQALANLARVLKKL